MKNGVFKTFLVQLVCPQLSHKIGHIAGVAYVTILRVFLGFRFLSRNKEKISIPHEERGIFEEIL